ncbi:MAG: TOMM system kinase/cyclase fusion protein [Alteromonadaceae bacterium]|nr:MAG: TOMM system kinase/cyclase fusion protein [Alteromonadaceae bacterium]
MTDDKKDSWDIMQRFTSKNYELIEKIGQGGFGQIYKAKQLVTGQTVAIKFLTLSAEFDDDKKKRYIARFEREAILGSRLQHPNIVRLLDKGLCDEDLLYAVFEYVDGESLKERLSRHGPLLPAETAQIMAQVLDALAHAHEQGVIHRDIKPANIMLLHTGTKMHAKVLDFGIGTLVHEARHQDYQSITLTQETLGTPSYSAPEQLRGEPPTPKTDIYVWGLVFIECLTGQPAISGASLASVFHKQLSQTNVPLPSAVAGHPVAALLRRVLNKKATERANSAASVYKELGQLNLSTLVGDVREAGQSYGAGHTTALTEILDNDTLVTDSQIYHSNISERKQITVLCLSLQTNNMQEQVFDHEIIDTLNRDQKAQCIDIAIRFGAFHVGTLADTLMFYFGYPLASDNDSRLAARTALEISSSLNKRNALLKQTQQIEIHPLMGMHTGIVTIYSDTVPEGETANIAMELARRAQATQILCSQSCRDSLESYIAFEPHADKLDTLDVKQLRLFLLTGERQVEAFGFLRAARQRHDFIGREDELNELTALLKTEKATEESTNGEATSAKLAHVHGEAGIGKSRLIFELRNSATDFNHYVAQCLPEYKNNALYPVLSLIKRKYSLDSMPPASAAAKLREQLAQHAELNDTKIMPVLCSWLALPLPEDIPQTADMPDAQKLLLFQALISLLTHVDPSEQTKPNLILFEDMHWADPTSVEFIGELSGSKAFCESPHVFISTSRQVLPNSLKASGFNVIQVTKLNQEKTGLFICSMFENRQVSDHLRDIVASRTDGIPLFIEELVGMLKQKKLVQHTNGITDFISADKLDEVPASLRDSLQQKLDALVYAKETAQLAATIGREFDYDLLLAATNHSEVQLQIDLNELAETELVFLQRRVGCDSYIFKHALVRDATYDSMVKQTRIHNHSLVAEALKNDFPKSVIDNPSGIANHYAGAAQYETAVEYGIKNIDQQVKSSTNDEAVSSGKLVLQWVKEIEHPSTKSLFELKIHDVMLPAVMTLYGYGAEEVSRWGNRVKEIANQFTKYAPNNEDKSYAEALIEKSEWTLFLAAHYCSHRADARALGEQIIQSAKSKGNRQREMVGMVHLAQAYYVDGDLELSARSYEDALAMYDEKLDYHLALEYGTDAKAQNLSLSAETYLNLGRIDTAYKNLYDSLEHAEEIDHQGSILFAHIIIAQVAAFLKDHDKVIEITKRYELKHGNKGMFWHLHYLYMYYYCTIGKNDLAKHALDQQFDSGQIFATGWYVTQLAQAYLKAGEVDRAAKLMEESLDKSLKYQEKASYPFIKRTLAECYHAIDGSLTRRIENLLASAISDAVEQKARYFELESRVYYYTLMDQDSEKGKKNKVEILQLLTSLTEIRSTPLFRTAKKLVGFNPIP